MTAGHPDTDPLAAIRRHLADALAAARRDLAEAEAENDRVRRELHLVLSSRGRQQLLRLFAFASALWATAAHPFWTTRVGLARVAARPPLIHLRRLVRRLRTRTLLLRTVPLAEASGPADAAQAPGWLGPVTFGGTSCEALRCPLDAHVTFRTPVVARARFVAACGVKPAASNRYGGGAVRFEVTLEDARGAWRRWRCVDCAPARRWRDRRWRRLTLPLPPHMPASEVVVTLRTSRLGRPGETPGEPLWGEPRFEAPRAWSEIRLAGRAWLNRLRAGGLREAWQYLRSRAAPDGERDQYALWLERHTLSPTDLEHMRAHAQALSYQPRFTVITPVYNTDPRWLRACIESVRHQIYPHWELCLVDDGSTNRATWQVLRESEADPRIRVAFLPSNRGISAASNRALAMASGEFIAVLDHDDELSADALYRVAVLLNEHPDADFVYSDEDKIDRDGRRCDPHFKPDWSPDHLLACMYTCHLMVLRRSLVEAVGGFREGFEGAQDYDLVLRVMERTSRIHHIPRILYHWRKLPRSAAADPTAKPWAHEAGRRALADYLARNGIAGEVLPGAAFGLFRVRRHIVGRPLVSIVIPTTGCPAASDGTDLLGRALESLVEHTSYDHFEVVLVTDTCDWSDAVRRVLERVPHRVVAWGTEQPFNFARKINAGVREAAGEHVVLFNDDLEVVQGEWLSAMLEYSQVKGVGAVGAKLVYPDGRLQHIGIVLGVAGVAAHAFHQYPGSCLGYAGSAVSPRNYSAVTAACMMTRRRVFEEVGGFDEGLAVDFNDVDYCLKLRRAGYRVVFTPYALLSHRESSSFGARTQAPRELAAMRAKWGDLVVHDPYFNPNFSRSFPDYRLEVDGR